MSNLSSDAQAVLNEIPFEAMDYLVLRDQIATDTGLTPRGVGQLVRRLVAAGRVEWVSRGVGQVDRIKRVGQARIK